MTESTTTSDELPVVSVESNGEVPSQPGSARRLPPSYKRVVSWQAHTVDPTAVQRALTRLWNEVAEERREALGKPRREGDAALMRTRTINLVGIADTTDDSDRIHSTVTSL